MSMIMIVMSIRVGIGWIIVALQDISVRSRCRQRMISFKIKLIFVVMGFDLLLMLIINLTVFLIISVRVAAVEVVGVDGVFLFVCKMRPRRTRNGEKKKRM